MAQPEARGPLSWVCTAQAESLCHALAVGYESIGIESDPVFYQMAERAIPRLAALGAEPKPSPETSVRRAAHDERALSFPFQA